MDAPPRHPLLDALPADGADADVTLDAFLGWVADQELSLYPAQEEAILELFAGKHVVLNTPTGSGKSLVATAQCFYAMARDERIFYTCPIKALVSEKFFDLCNLFGADSVGMLTGDASVNRGAPIICCTAEVLANIAVREGDAAEVDHVVMDEFHYYGDADRGMAWQVPLLTLPQATFMLMSATLGDTADIRQQLADFTGRECALVAGDERPVPLDFDYREVPLHQTILSLVDGDRAPIYVVSFTQRECAELAQGLTSVALAERAQRDKIRGVLGTTRFDSPYGSDIKRMLAGAIGLHHAGLLPKYRRVVERLAQEGLLKVICGTDTLGVGVNVPIRTVVFTKLCKFDGEKTARLTARDFKQIAGRAGRKGFDTRGTVACQAPAHTIENRQLEQKAGDDPKKRRRLSFKKPPDRGYVHWDEGIFRQLIEKDPEPLQSRFSVDHGMLLSLLQTDHGRHGGYGALLDIIARSHEREHDRRRHRRTAKQVFRSLLQSEIIELERKPGGVGNLVQVAGDLQDDFSLHHSLSLFLVEALGELDRESPDFAMHALSLAEAALEHPRVVLYAQERKAKDRLMAEMKADGLEYEERMAKLEQVSYPKPDADAIYDAFNAYRQRHPWLADDNIRPKSIARDMFERCASFSEYVKEYGLKTSEGVLLRYLSQAYKLLLQSVPEAYLDGTLLEVIAFLRAALERIDSSLVQEWETLRRGEDAGMAASEPVAFDMARDPRALRSRVRADMHLLLRALSQRDFEEAALSVVDAPDDEGNAWDADRFEAVLAPYEEHYGPLRFDAVARYTDRTRIDPAGPRHYRVTQRLADPEDHDDWFVEAEVVLPEQGEPAGPLLRILALGC